MPSSARPPLQNNNFENCNLRHTCCKLRHAEPINHIALISVSGARRSGSVSQRPRLIHAFLRVCPNVCSFKNPVVANIRSPQTQCLIRARVGW